MLAMSIRQDKEKLVVELYREGKSYRDIASYLENLGKEIMSEIELDSFEGLYAASHHTYYKR